MIEEMDIYFKIYLQIFFSFFFFSFGPGIWNTNNWNPFYYLFQSKHSKFLILFLLLYLYDAIENISNPRDYNLSSLKKKKKNRKINQNKFYWNADMQKLFIIYGGNKSVH